MKKYLLKACFCAACGLGFLPEIHGANIPTIDEVAGNYIESDSTMYATEGNQTTTMMWKCCTDVNLSRIEGSETKLMLSGFWRSLRGEKYSFEVEYDDYDGTIIVPAGSVVYVDNMYDPTTGLPIGENDMKVYGYVDLGDGTWDFSERPIRFSYNPDKRHWACHSALAIVADIYNSDSGQPERMIADIFFHSTLIPANGTAYNESYGIEWNEETPEKVSYGKESRPCYVDEKNGTIMNLIYTDQFGHGAVVPFQKAGNSVALQAALIAEINDIQYPYKALVGVNIESGSIIPKATSDGSNAGTIERTADFTIFNFGSSAIYPAVLSSDYTIQIDESRIYEVVEKLRVEFTPEQNASSEKLSAEKGKIIRTDYYDLSGCSVAQPENGRFLLKRTVFSDGHTTTEKVIFQQQAF